MTQMTFLMTMFYSSSVLHVPQVFALDVIFLSLSYSFIPDYNSFKHELIQAVDMERIQANEYANTRWNKFGQQFLQLCIAHKTMSLETREFVTDYLKSAFNSFSYSFL